MSTKKVTFNNSRLVVIPAAGPTDELDEVRPTTKADDGGRVQDVEQPKKSSSKTVWKHYTIPIILLTLSIMTFATFLGIGETTTHTELGRVRPGFHMCLKCPRYVLGTCKIERNFNSPGTGQDMYQAHTETKPTLGLWCEALLGLRL